MNCMSKRVQRAKNKLANERYRESIKNMTPEEHDACVKREKRGRKAMEFLTSSMIMAMSAGAIPYTQLDDANKN